MSFGCAYSSNPAEPERTKLRALSDKTLDSLHWLTLALTLPKDGVEKHFKSESARLNRLIEVRWPNGPTCRRCNQDSLTWVGTRSVFQCSRCRFQFSVAVDTLLHRTRLSFGIWFKATESLILYHARGSLNYDMPAQALAADLGIAYVAARRTRRIILADISRGGSGFLRTAICIQPLEVPPNIQEHSDEHVWWLTDAFMSRKAHRS